MVDDQQSTSSLEHHYHHHHQYLYSHFGVLGRALSLREARYISTRTGLINKDVATGILIHLTWVTNVSYLVEYVIPTNCGNVWEEDRLASNDIVTPLRRSIARGPHIIASLSSTINCLTIKWRGKLMLTIKRNRIHQLCKLQYSIRGWSNWRARILLRKRSWDYV